MFSHLERIDSASLGQKVHLWRYGHFGPPVLVFPSSAGLAHEWEYNGLVEVLGEKLESGRLKLYCTESNVSEAWLGDGDPAWRIGRHQAFERYVLNELVPMIREDCRTPTIRISCAGTSLGAYYAANFVLKHPELFDYGLCLSGRYDATTLTDGFNNLDVYDNNPLAFVPNLCGDPLDRVRRSVHLDLVCGQGDWEGANIEATSKFAAVLADKGISHQLALWGHDVTHEWKWWNRQALFYLHQRLG